ncbi:anaerobic C4-dicarboxylate transporter family protein [Klebsiella pneumoniae]|uniref:anaerobic C4-dicarboxylate transporter family protein n=1 Tax=Klebsiella pneumoniae TaxID=573 RepID=UPI003A4C6A6B
MDYLVSLAERMLRRHPKYITFLAPLVTCMAAIAAITAIMISITSKGIAPGLI